MKVLVTGGTGFLGRAIVKRLVDRGDTVRVLARGHLPTELPLGVELRRVDVTDADAVRRAVQGRELVFHTAAKAGVAGPEEAYRRVNVDGTTHVIEACRGEGVRALVHTSSPSVVFGGGDMEGADESVPYPPRHLAAYPRTKAEAERRVLAADAPAGLRTTALRPHLVWGPGDNHLVPRLVARARSGRLRRVGDGANRVDACYIDNAADAHVAAADRLLDDGVPGGKPYFIANDEPVPLWELVDRILDAAGLPPVRRSVPAGLAYAVGAVSETLHALLGRSGEPLMTRFVAKELATSHWFDLSAARRDLRWEPRVSTDEGLARLAAALQAPGGGA